MRTNFAPRRTRLWRYPGQGPKKSMGKEAVSVGILILHNTKQMISDGLLQVNQVGDNTPRNKFFT